MKVFILIPTRNRKEFLDKCLSSFINQTYKDIKIIVVDDGSTDSTSNLIEDKYKGVVLIKGDGNLWWTGAMRIAVDYVKSKYNKNDFIFIQNDDTFIKPDLLENLVKISLENNRMIVGTSLKDFNNDELIYNAHNVIKCSFRPCIVDGTTELIDTGTLSGRGVLIPVEVFEKIGNFSKLFPHYAADYDFFCRAKKSGFVLKVRSNNPTYLKSERFGLAGKIKKKNKKSVKDIYDLFFNRRSANNLYSNSLLILRHVPFPKNIFGFIYLYLYFIKFIIVDFFLCNLFILIRRNK